MARLVVQDVDKCVGCMSCMFACSRRFSEGGLAKSAIHVASIGGVERGFKVVVCRGCEEPSCAAACPTGALVKRKGGGVILNPARCIGCGNCARACPIGAVMWDYESNKPIICVHCGYCTSYCPYGVLALSR
ncbi:4Fe-4S dicluster domain-containing protein [Infirmifilum sp. SLHALR2]|nr:MAG: [Fe-S]-binding protein [Thermofilum sp. NZ13]